MEHPNAALVRDLFAAFDRGDVGAVVEAFAEDAVWHVPGRSALAGDHRGREAILGFLGKAIELGRGTLSLELLDVLASDTRAAQWRRLFAERDGRRIDVVEAIVHRIEGGRIVETHHRTEQYPIDEFFA